MPDEVKRYSVDIPDAVMLPYPDGEFVLATDYDRLRAERDALAGAHGRLRDLVKRQLDNGATGKYIDENGVSRSTHADLLLELARDLPADGVREAAKKLLDKAEPIDPNNQWWFRVRDTHINALRTALGETP